MDPHNLHLKIFVAGEVFQHMLEAVLLNPLKAIRNPVYLIWRPRDLLRFISWRLYRHLEDTGLVEKGLGQIDWDDYDDVHAKVWVPYFGKTLTNAKGKGEATWPYVLRHTQMRPRQLIHLCNAIANRATEDGTFPYFKEAHIIAGIKDAESDLASEIVNSFSEIYPRADRIISAFMRMPKVFTGNELDIRAAQSRRFWPVGDYEPWRFSQMVAELGIIGRVTRKGIDTEYIDADFEYSSPQRLELTHRDLCVVHPMFYRRLNIDLDTDARVMPFTTER